MTLTGRARSIAVAVTVILLMHVGGMTVDPIGMHADAATVSTHAAMGHGGHAGHAGNEAQVDPDPTVALHHMDLVSILACLDTEGVPAQARVPLEPVSFVGVIPEPIIKPLRIDAPFLRVWEPPAMDASQLRVFLQVFLN